MRFKEIKQGKLISMQMKKLSNGMEHLLGWLRVMKMKNRNHMKVNTYISYKTSDRLAKESGHEII